MSNIRSSTWSQLKAEFPEIASTMRYSGKNATPTQDMIDALSNAILERAERNRAAEIGVIEADTAADPIARLAIVDEAISKIVKPVFTVNARSAPKGEIIELTPNMETNLVANTLRRDRSAETAMDVLYPKFAALIENLTAWSKSDVIQNVSLTMGFKFNLKVLRDKLVDEELASRRIGRDRYDSNEAIKARIDSVVEKRMEKEKGVSNKNVREIFRVRFGSKTIEEIATKIGVIREHVRKTTIDIINSANEYRLFDGKPRVDTSSRAVSRLIQAVTTLKIMGNKAPTGNVVLGLKNAMDQIARFIVDMPRNTNVSGQIIARDNTLRLAAIERVPRGGLQQLRDVGIGAIGYGLPLRQFIVSEAKKVLQERKFDGTEYYENLSESLSEYIDDVVLSEEISILMLFTDAHRGGAKAPGTGAVYHTVSPTKAIVHHYDGYYYSPGDNDCLFHALRLSATRNQKVPIPEVRHLLELPEGPVSMLKFPKVAEYYGSEAQLYTDVVRRLDIQGHNISISKSVLKTMSLKELSKTFKAAQTAYLTGIYGEATIPVASKGKSIRLMSEELGPNYIYLQDKHYSIIHSVELPIICDITGEILPVSQDIEGLGVRPLPSTEKKKGGFNVGTIKEKLLGSGRIATKDIQTIHLVYDLETFYGADGKLGVYSYCFIAYDDAGQKLQCVYDVCKDSKWQEELALVMESFLKQYRIKYGYKIEMFGYNNSRFDDFFLMSSMIKAKLANGDSIQLSGNSMVISKFANVRLTDLARRLAPGSLASYCSRFGVEDGLSKIDLAKTSLKSHRQIQEIYLKYLETDKDTALEKFLGDMRGDNDLKAYNIRDVEATYALYTKYRDALAKITDGKITDPLEYPTIAALAEAAWKTDRPADVKAPKTRTDFNFFRKAVYAGRAEMWNLGKNITPENDSYMIVDVKSLYPYIMRNCSFPIGDYTETKSFVPQKHGFYRCDVGSQAHLKTPIIPKRGETLDWKNTEPISDIVLNSVDISILQGNGVQVTVHEGFYWEKNTDDMFSSYVDLFEREKSKQDRLAAAKSPEYNVAIRELAKLFLNSLSGKVCQRIFDTTTAFMGEDWDTKVVKAGVSIQDVETIESDVAGTFFIKYTKEKKYSADRARPNYLGALIYSFARAHMYESILKHSETKVGMDTDSCFMLKSEVPRIADIGLSPEHRSHVDKVIGWGIHRPEFFGKFSVGSEFGQFEDEGVHGDTFYGCGPKFYAFAKGGVPQKMKGKGLPGSGRGYVILVADKSDNTPAEIEKFRDNSFLERDSEFHKLDAEGKSHSWKCIQVYEALCAGKDVYVLMSYLRKRTAQITITQEYVVKRVRVRGL